MTDELSPRRALPSVDAVLQHPSLAAPIEEWGRAAVCDWARHALAGLRSEIVSENGLTRAALLDRAADDVVERGRRAAALRLDEVINATGVVLHTNLGRAPLADRAASAISKSLRYANVEMDLDSGERRYRGHQLDDLWRQVTGAEASLVVNNCAGATLLALAALGVRRDVIVARGQLIEIGGAYRLPDVFAQSGACLKEVGTTNRTRLSDYADAIGPQTAAILRVHQSNFRTVGFVEDVSIEPLVKLAHERGILALDDVGSGCLSDLAPFGLGGEPLVQNSIACGADLVIFSGDKLFGGPQAGILLGRKPAIELLKKHPLARALRIDKLTLAALGATLEIHAAGNALEEIPTLRMLTIGSDELRARADRIVGHARSLIVGADVVLDVAASEGAVGGGSMPTTTLPGWAVVVASQSPDGLATALRRGKPPVICQIKDGRVYLDVRTVLDHQEVSLGLALAKAITAKFPDSAD